jgi:CRISPR system Cascade subunit CasC
MFIEIHMLQNFAPSNLNRDDTNNPKDCEFGGVRRARISSQCLKRAIRNEDSFARVTGVPVSQRTVRIVSALAKGLQEKGKSAEEAKTLAEEFAKHYSSKKGTALEESKTNVLLFLSKQEEDEIVNRLLEMAAKPDEIKKYAEDFAKNTKKRPAAPDIALFGRMLADRPETNIDAACQVAHAISTHAVNMDIDFFTAVDDLLPVGESGAGMMGVTGFNSACFYRYACIDYNLLLANLNGDAELARKTVEGFLRASVRAIPTGKQNSFGAQNPPSFMMVVVRDDGQCWSLANAFEKPVYGGGGSSLLEGSMKSLDTYWGKLVKFYGGAVNPFVACLDGCDNLDALKPSCVASLEDWVNAVIKALQKG